jgi:competence protein ComFC
VILRSAIDALAAVLFPAPCRICANTLLTASRIPICEQCFASFETIQKPICLCCGRPFLNRTDITVDAEQLELGASAQTHCRLCRDQFYKFELARSFGAYNEALNKAILLLRFEEVTCLGDWFASRLAEVVNREAELFRADVVVPVPLHPDRQRERGYNQAELITSFGPETASKTWSVPADATRPRPPRLVLSRKEHWDSVRGAYATRQGLRVDKLRVLLVDDVMTTGATLDSCARALKAAGATVVMGLTVARVVPAGHASGSRTVIRN